MSAKRIFVGFDERELTAYRVAEASIAAFNSGIPVGALVAERLRQNGLLTRPTDLRGQRYDLISNAPMSTDFAISRFAAHFLMHQGWAMFVDCDVVCLRNPAELFALADGHYAVMCVKHDNLMGYPTGAEKMDGQVQTFYARKNWSSVMLVNCDHPANRRFTLHDLNTRPGRDLHAFYWLHDSEIGELPADWNWLVNVNEKPKNPGIAHFTLGGPWLPNWRETEHDEIWLDAAKALL